MAETGDETANDEAGVRADAGNTFARMRSRRWRRVAGGTGLALVMALGVVWAAREPLTDHFVAGELTRLKLPAHYRIDSITPAEQVLSNIVVGDPAHPDLTIDRVIARTGVRGGVPGITGVTLVRPRFRGTWRDGKLSLGSLDTLLAGPSTGPFRLPDLVVEVIDGEGTVATDSGKVGIALSGSGALRDGFAGLLGASWPGARLGGCAAGKAVFAGRISVANERPGLTGPLRFDRFDCAGGLAAGVTRIDLAGSLDPAHDGGIVNLGLVSSGLRGGGAAVRGAGGSVQIALRGKALTARYQLALAGLAAPQANARQLGFEGVMRGDAGLAALTAEGALTGADLAPGSAASAALVRAGKAAQGTLAQPLLAQLARGLAREGPGSRLSGQYVLHRQGGALSLVLPQALVTGGSGATVLALSRLAAQQDGAGNWQLAGNLQTGGRDLPGIRGRMERDAAGRDVLRLAMADYLAGGSRLAIPGMTLAQARGGALGFAGGLVASGPLPGGEAVDLHLSVNGDWSPRGGLALWRACTEIGFARLRLANLTLERRGLTLCPGNGHAIVESGARGTRIAAGATALDLSGRLGATPVRITSGPVGFAVPGTLTAKAIDVALGEGAGTSRFRLANVEAKTAKELAGRFAGTDIVLAAVPIDLRDAAGNWRYADGTLAISGAELRVVDRSAEPRFNPLVAHDGTLALADNRITAQATLRAPRSDRAVARLDLRHDLSSGMGHADLAVADLSFDKDVQPDTLTPLALGVVANAKGVVKGAGTIDWTADKVTSSAKFSTDSLDLAAAFGPAKGIAGTVTFTDLLGLVTAPRQHLTIAAINPGIEVNDGTLTFAMLPGHVLAIDGAEWPFLDGRLELLPTRMTVGIAETRRYVLRVSGISAARFIERMEISNLAATGVFDGTLPLVFDQNGGWISGGKLVSRAPGGNVSYVGELTYKDLSPMANFAFQTLRALDYRQMTIGMDGPLAGQLVTRVSMSGVTQGKGTKQNFLTRQIAHLPIRFDVNIRAPFYQLVTSFKSFYDPTYLRDPRSLGLIDAQGRAVPGPLVPANPTPATDIQPPVSEPRP